MNIIFNKFIPKSKRKMFIKLLEDYDYDINTLTLINSEQPVKINHHKIPLDKLKEKLFSEQEKSVEVDVNLDIDIDTTLSMCDNYEREIRRHELVGKKYYYFFGLYLARLKYLMTLDDYSPKEINIFIEERYHIKISTINKYIRFSELCDYYLDLLNSKLTYNDIMNNIPEIEKLYSE